ncbi:hypothetical protein [Piscirickettsia salmonis]|uniref:hypothetical protein n=1 Tax=Piscirickettsia salmonis TaxID=1238 RepID=UPI000D1C5086
MGKVIEEFNTHFWQEATQQQYKQALEEFRRLEPGSAMADYTYSGLKKSCQHLKANLTPDFKEDDHYSSWPFPLSLGDPKFYRSYRIDSNYERVQDALNVYSKYQQIQSHLKIIKERHPEMSEVCDKISTLSADLFTHGLKIARSGRINPLEDKRFNQHLNYLSTLTFKLAHNPPSKHAQAFTQYKQDIKKSPWLKIQLTIKSIFSAFNKLTQRHSNEAPSDKELRLNAAQLGLSQDHESQKESIAKTSLPFLDHAHSSQHQESQQAVELTSHQPGIAS